MSLQKRITAYNKNLTRLERELLDKLLKSREKFNYKTFTIENIAEFFKTSTSTVHRISKKLEYKSFIQFKDDFFEKNKFGEEKKDFLDNSYMNSILETYNLVSMGLKDDIIDKMEQCKRITFYSIGVNKYLGRIFKMELQKLGVPVDAHDDPKFMALSSKILRRHDDLVFIISRSGETKALLEVLVEANLNGVDVVLITGNKGSTFERLCKHVIYTGSESSLDDSDTRINAHIAMDIIIRKFEEKYRKK
ncbi:MAG: MurR/RpiR family transcriptional regulator [Clostridium sp.]|uniref:MurR/RpiR family transcriptional regulator n=1 Tax=Clostridium sp. TaxID=1506 RepID=UPI002FC6E52A